METKNMQNDENSDQTIARRILLVTAVLSTVFGVLYFVGLVGKLLVNGSIHAQSSPAISMIAASIGILWDVTLVILLWHSAAGYRQVGPSMRTSACRS
jgi:uncharacterized membrane protein YeiB